MLWACILLPQLALDGVLRRHPDPDAPLALVGGPAQRRMLRAVVRSPQQEDSIGDVLNDVVITKAALSRISDAASVAA